MTESLIERLTLIANFKYGDPAPEFVSVVNGWAPAISQMARDALAEINGAWKPIEDYPTPVCNPDKEWQRWRVMIQTARDEVMEGYGSWRSIRGSLQWRWYDSRDNWVRNAKLYQSLPQPFTAPLNDR